MEESGGERKLIADVFQSPHIINQTVMNSKKNQSEPNKFIVKLVAMMKDFPSIIGWSEDGMELQINNVQLFTKEVHPLYYPNSNYKSFLRQLNMYNFSKMSKRKNSINFRHPDFSKGQDHLFQTIKRKKQSIKGAAQNAKDFPESGQLSSKQMIPQNEQIAANISSQMRQLLGQVKHALEGRAMEGFLKLQGQIAKLQKMEKASLQEKSKKEDTHLFKEFLSMHKIQRLAGSHKEVFTQSDFGYNLQQSIFNEEEPEI